MHLIGKKLLPLFSHKLFIFIIMVIAVLLYLPSLFNGFHTDDYTHLLHFNQKVQKKMGIANRGIYKNKLDLYSFSGKNTNKNDILRNKGYLPWWTHRNMNLNFFRPLTSLTLAFDYTLWPDNPLIIHIHSLCWLLILLFLLFYVYRQLNMDTGLAGLACLFFILDDVNIPVAFIANRHSIIAAVCAVSAFLCYIRYSGSRKIFFLIGSYVLFTASLFASEMGITICAFLFSYTLFIDKDTVRKKITKLIPFILIIIIWRILYIQAGYGVTDQILYVDPLNNPVGFIKALSIRFPILLLSGFFIPIADLLFISSPTAHIFIAIIALCILILMFVIFFPFLKRSKILLFWITAVLFSIIPLCAGLPSNRLLGFAGIGIMGFIVIIIKQLCLIRNKNELSLFHRISFKLSVPVILIIFCLLNPLMIVSTPSLMQQGKEIREKITDFGTDTTIADNTLFIVKHPAASPLIAGITERAFSGKPLPQFIRLLSSGMQPLAINRVDDNTLIIKPEGGYNPLPAGIPDPATGKVNHFHPGIINLWTDTFFYNPDSPWKKGERIILSWTMIEVLDVTGNGRISEIKLTCEKSLEDEKYIWITWDQVKNEYVRFTLPGIGEKMER